MTQSNWDNLDPQQQAIFERIADKPSSDMSAEEWFDHLVPEELQSNSEYVEVFMNGGTVTTEEWTYDQGMANGHYEEVEWQIDDRDVSRIESGANGGDYTADNTIMEDSSINRSRGADTMTDAEYSDAADSNQRVADLFEQAPTVQTSAATEAAEATDTFASMAEVSESTSFLADGADFLLEGVLPAIIAAKVGTAVAERCDTKKQKLGWGMLSAGGTVLLAATPPGQLACAGYATWSLGKFAYKSIRRAFYTSNNNVVAS